MSIPLDLVEWRKARRAELLRRRIETSADDHAIWSRSITALLERGFPVLQKMVVGFYWPYKNEFDTRCAVQFFLERGARAVLPTVIEKNAPMQFREWRPDFAMKPGAYAIPVPDSTSILTPDAVLTPVVGFGEQGDRLGYGKGFFDRTLAAISPQPLKIAVAFELSRIPTTYPQPYDVQMDFVITEAGIHVVEREKMQSLSADECARVSHQLALDRGLPRRQDTKEHL